MIDTEQPISLTWGTSVQASEEFIEYQPNVEAFCRSLRKLRDPNLARDFEMKLNAPAESK